MTDYRYPKTNRLLKPDQFKAVFNAPLFKAHQTHLMAFVSHNDREKARLGMAITKKKVPTAVARNRLKRLTREQFRHKHDSLPAVDIVFIVKKPVTELSNEQLSLEISEILANIIRKYRRLSKTNQVNRPRNKTNQ